MKKIFYPLLIVCVVLAACAPATPTCPEKGKLAFRDGKFKIAQFTDLHWGSEDPKKDSTAAAIKMVVAEEKPDFIVVTGDVVFERPAPQGWKEVIELFDSFAIPYTVVLGNHDAEAWATDYDRRHLTKDSIYAMLGQSPYYRGSTKADAEYAVYSSFDVYGHDTVAAHLYCMDTGDYPKNKRNGTYDWLHRVQLDWYSNQNADKILPSLIFLHIPIPEYRDVAENDICLGAKNESICDADVNAGLLARILDKGDVMGVFCGHDHGNDFIGMTHGIALAYGNCSGYNAYGVVPKGGRIIMLFEDRREFETWTFNVAGRGDVFYYPSGLTSKEEREINNFLPALSLSAAPAKHGVAYAYYEGPFMKTTDLSAKTLKRTGTMSNFIIDPTDVEDHYGYEFDTLLQIPEDGVYKFSTYSDDGSVLYIDGQKVVDNDGDHGPKLVEGKVALKAGFHRLKVAYFENYMGQRLEITYSGKHVPLHVIADEELWLEETAAK